MPAELTPEERLRIYQEERERIEAEEGGGADPRRGRLRKRTKYSRAVPIPPDEADSRQGNGGLTRSINPWVAVIIVAFVMYCFVFVCTGGDMSLQSSHDVTSTVGSSTTSEPDNIGDVGFLDNGDTSVYVADSKSDFDKLSAAILAKDDVGFQSLVSTGTVFSVPSRTQAKWLGADGIGVFHVRIIGGSHDGQEAWTDMENLHKQ